MPLPLSSLNPLGGALLLLLLGGAEATFFDEVVPTLTASTVSCKSSRATAALNLPSFNGSTYPSRADLGHMCLRQQPFTCCSAAHSEALMLRLFQCDQNAEATADSEATFKRGATCCSKLATLRCYGCEGVVGMLGSPSGGGGGGGSAGTAPLPLCPAFAFDVYKACSGDGLFFAADEHTAMSAGLPQMCGEGDILCAPFSEIYHDQRGFFASLGLAVAPASPAATSSGGAKACWDGGFGNLFTPDQHALAEIEEVAASASLQPAGSAAGGGFKSTRRRRAGAGSADNDSDDADSASKTGADKGPFETLRRAVYVHAAPFIGRAFASALANHLEPIVLALGVMLVVNLFLVRMVAKSIKNSELRSRPGSSGEGADIDITASPWFQRQASSDGNADVEAEIRQRRIAALQQQARLKQQQQAQQQPPANSPAAPSDDSDLE